MSDTANEDKKSGSLGKKICTLGVAMVTSSVILAFAGVSGAQLHNVLQIGGIAIAIVGVVMWKVLKK